MEAKAKARERGREAAAAALLGTTKSIESRRDFPHFISAWPPSALTKPMDNGQRRAASDILAFHLVQLNFFLVTVDPLVLRVWSRTIGCCQGKLPKDAVGLNRGHY